MDFLKLAKERFSCRKLSDKPVEKEKIDKILEAAISAPTGMNRQPFKIWVVNSEEGKSNLAKVTPFTFGANVFFVVGYNTSDCYVRPFDGRNFADVDTSIVATHILLEVQDLGLGTTWVGHFDAPALKRIYPEMADYELIAIFPVGYPAEDVKPAGKHFERKSAKELVTYI